MSLPARVGIVGLGLMGGSLARDLKTLSGAPHVAAFSRDPGDLEAALREGTVDEIHGDPDPVARQRDLVVYATPLDAVSGLLEAHRGLWGPETVITDLASLKEPVLKQARSLGILERFVGSHPMTGGEGAGYTSGRTGLYRDAVVWVVRDGAAEDATEMVEELWRAVGARPRRVAAGDHDRRMIRASHLPQLLANALARSLGRAGVAREELGPGGRDMTRLARSNPEVWLPILRHSGPELARALEEMTRSLDELARTLGEEDLDQVLRLMEECRGWAEGEPWS